MIARRIAPSLLVLVDIEPFASTKPARPRALR